VADGPRKAALKAVLDLADNGIRLQGLRKRVRQEKRERGAARQGVENARQWRETIRAHELSKITAPDQAAAAQTATIRTSSPTAERPSSLRTQSAPSPGLAKPVTHDHASVPAISESEQTRSRGQAPVREVPPAQESSLADTLRQRLESRRQGPLDERFNESADAQRQAKAERKRERAERKQREYLKRQAEYARDNRGHDREHSR